MTTDFDIGRSGRPRAYHAHGVGTGGNVQARRASASWVLRHWRGELSLPVSYWLNGLLASVVVGGVALAAVVAAVSTRSLPLAFAATAAAYVFVFAVVIWHVVGIWRSATSASARRPRSLWPVLAKFMVIVGCLLQTSRLPIVVDQLSDLLTAALGDPSEGKRGVRVLNEAEIEISGVLSRGIPVELELALAREPNVRMVHLNSPGGRVAVAEDLSDIIGRHGLDTIVDKECDSACTVVLLAGRQRWMRPQALIGFHAGSVRGIRSVGATLSLRGDYTKARLPNPFIAKALATAPADIWRPTRRELLNASVVSAVASDDQFAVGGFGPAPSIQDVSAQLLAIPTFKAIKQADPAAYLDIEAAYQRVALEGGTLGDFNRLAHAKTIALVRRLKGVAPDDAIIDFAHVGLKEITALQAADPEVCWRYLTSGQVDIARYFSPELIQADRDATTKLLVDATAKPSPPTTRDAERRLFIQATAIIQQRGGDPNGAVRNFLPTAPHAAVCAASKALLGAALSIEPRSDAAMLLRAILSGK